MKRGFSFRLFAVLLLSAAFTGTASAVTAVDLVNSLRRQHDAPEVVYNDTLEADAGAWARQLSDAKALQHSDARGAYGENLGVVSPFSSFVGTAAWEKVVAAWYSEGENPETGHFTQLVWKETTSIALGMAVDYAEDKLYVVMRFYPAGNVLGQFDQNVSPVVVDSEATKLPLAPPPPTNQPAIKNVTLSCFCSKINGR